MLPVRDELPPLKASFLTWAILLGTIAAYFLWQQPASPELMLETAVIPCELITGEPLSEAEALQQVSCQRGDTPLFSEKSLLASLLYSMVLHGGLLHLGFNMWTFWVFANNVEDAFGHVQFLAMYVLAGIVGSMAHVVLNPASTIPLVGASGAIAGVMGAYLVLFPRARIVSMVPPLFFFHFRVPAVVFLGIWFVSQFYIVDEGIAWLAHVGGFAVGFLWALARRDAHHARLRRLRVRRRR